MIIQSTNITQRPFAYLLVTYPSGSVCTSTNTLGGTSVSSTQIAFEVLAPSSGSTQTCVVTITNGTDTRSKTVSSIQELEARSTSVNYPLILMENASEYVAFTNGKYTNQNYLGTFSVYSQMWKLDVVSWSRSIWRYCAVDITNYSTLLCNAFRGDTLANTSRLVVSNTLDNPFSNPTAGCDITGTSSQTFSADISTLTGELYLGVGVCTNASVSESILYCSKLWLE